MDKLATLLTVGYDIKTIINCVFIVRNQKYLCFNNQKYYITPCTSPILH